MSEGEAKSAESEEEWEDTLLMLQLPSKVASNKYDGDTYCQILGITSDQPLVKIKNHLFTGQPTQTLGSHLFLEMEGKPGTQQAMKNQIKNITVGHKTMSLAPVYLTPKDAPGKDKESTDTEK